MGEHDHCERCCDKIDEIHEMLTEIKAFLDPLKSLAAGLGPMQRMGMSPQAKAALARING